MRVRSWDYLIITASNDAQAEAYESQLAVRTELGLLSDVGEAIVVADPGGKRVGSGGSTLCCLMEVLRRQIAGGKRKVGPRDWEEVLGRLRILIIHAGGDSRRLPAYGPCGKIFIPVPGENDAAVYLSLFDRQLPIYLALPESEQGQGQVVIASGDVLLRFDPEDVRFSHKGVTGLTCHAQPEQASRHGVFCQDGRGKVLSYLQKPSVAEQKARGAINAYGQSCLDIGVMHFDADTAVRLLRLFGVRSDREGGLVLGGRRGKAVLEQGLDFYREICCAMGEKARLKNYLKSAKDSGSKWSESMLTDLYENLSEIPFGVQVLQHCDFLDFGASRAILSSGTRLLQEDRGISFLQGYLDINNEITPMGMVHGSPAWVEGCRINSRLTLGGNNIVVGTDLDEPLALPTGACLDVIEGRNRGGRRVWFVRYYGIDDTFKDTANEGAGFCGLDLDVWLAEVGADPESVWPVDTRKEDRGIWDAQLFPAVTHENDYRKWQWMLDPSRATDDERAAWMAVDRYSLKEILAFADHKEFYARRGRLRAEMVRQSLRKAFCPSSRISAQELAYLMRDGKKEVVWLIDILEEAYRYNIDRRDVHTASLVFPRIIHTLGSALMLLYADQEVTWQEVMPEVEKQISLEMRQWLNSLDLSIEKTKKVWEWAERAHHAAFESLGSAILDSGTFQSGQPRSVLRSDEIVWARAPARLDVGGGWTDTPPYSLEWGGCVTNVAVDLNGQPPIQAYVRVIDKPIIKIGSIDLGQRVEIQRFEDLLDYRTATGSFALAKAAMVLCGLTPNKNGSSKTQSLAKALKAFGGGLELTTLAAIPKGSGLGTSSIMGAVIVAALSRTMGQALTQRELFHKVLRLEQSLTTGGGWQDQIGGVVGGVKMIVSEPGMVPDAHIHYVPQDIIDPERTRGQVLLYYTGITRLAKNILHQVVGRYMSRSRDTVATLGRIGSIAHEVMDAFIRKDIKRFGDLIDTAWELNKRLDPNSSNDQIEQLLGRIRPHLYGAKLLGAGGGGFLLMICKSPSDAMAIREMLESDPPNERARFFQFNVSNQGLVVTVS